VKARLTESMSERPDSAHVPKLRRSKVEQRYAHLRADQLEEVIGSLRVEMERCATELRFEEAAKLRDDIKELERLRARA